LSTDKIVTIPDELSAFELLQSKAYKPGEYMYEFSFLYRRRDCEDLKGKLEEFYAFAKPLFDLKAKLWAAGGRMTMNIATGEIKSELLEEYKEVEQQLDLQIALIKREIFGEQHDYRS
jgi:hypothetical protein